MGGSFQKKVAHLLTVGIWDCKEPHLHRENGFLKEVALLGLMWSMA